MNYLNYFKFFGNHCFNDNEERRVKFYEDGSFSLYVGANLLLYSKDCVLVKTFEYTPLRFDNGCIAIEDAKQEKINVYHNGEFAYCFDIGIGNKILGNSGNFLLLETSKGKQFYRITPTNAKKFQYSFNEHRFHRFGGYKALGDWIYLSFSSNECNFPYLINEDDVNVAPDGMIGFEPLKDGSYIIKTKTGDSLYNANHEKVLFSRKPKGILPLGPCHVLYESTLIADTCSGIFVKEYAGEEAVSPGDVFVFPYKFVKENDTLFWMGGNFTFFKVEDNWLFVTYYDGKLYPIFIDDKIDDNLLLDNNIPKDYATKLAMMSFVRETRRIYPPVL